MKRFTVIACILVNVVLSQVTAQNQSTYKHPSLDFRFTASENWKKIDHPEDKMILEMVDPDDAIHVILVIKQK